MYIPKHYNNEDHQLAFEIINKYPFGTLISNLDSLQMTKIPFDLYDQSYLFGHIATKNPQANQLKEGVEVICFFDGPHHYISPSVYVKKEVPTWNYIAVSLKCHLEIINDTNEHLNYLNKMVMKYENNRQNAFQLSDMSDEVLKSYSKAIKGFKCHIKEIEFKTKLSQNKTKETQTKVVQWLESLKNENALDVANYMKKNLD